MSTWSTAADEPHRYRSRPVEVSALYHDGSAARARAIAAWIAEAGQAYTARVDDRLVIIDCPPGDGGAVVMRPGEYLVQTLRGGQMRWSSWPASQFLAAHRCLPRELPIFDDGEVA